MAGRIYNIANRIQGAKPVLQVDDEHSFKINNSLAAVITINAISDDEELPQLERLKKIVGVALGKEAIDLFLEREYSIKDWEVITMAVMAGIGDEDLEEMEEKAKNELEGKSGTI